MMLRRQALILGLILALPVAGLSVLVADRGRIRDMELALSRVVKSQVNEQVRERCESDPRWFLTGPLDGRPKKGDPVNPNPDALQPRPKSNPQPFDLFAYDEAFLGSSTAAPRFLPEFRHALQASAREVFAPYVTPEGTGVQMAVPTGWIASPCMYFMGRMQPPPDQRSRRWRLFAGSFFAVLIVALLAAAPTIWRVRRFSGLARASKNDGYSTIALGQGKDELNAVVFVYNDAVNELRLRRSRIDDLDAGLRRFVQSTDDEIAGPLRDLERELSGGNPVTGGALIAAHDLAAKVENLTAAARLRMSGTVVTTEPVDLTALVRRVSERHAPVARAAGVSMDTSLPSAPVTIQGDVALIERAVSNVVDNAIRYNTRGGNVSLNLSRQDPEGRFRLWIADNGPGVTEEDFKTLTAIRRFRGDEGRNRRPGAPGLGLAVTREVADRSQLQFELRRPGAGGLEAEFSGKLSSS